MSATDRPVAEREGNPPPKPLTLEQRAALLRLAHVMKRIAARRLTARGREGQA